ncbi:hypothetical protein XBJ2_2270001 [Xenorhabdus bovienii str. Jollieti]|uniref:Uncharacterized protein n=1 Tax=Xenorhabdus bovienii (strain SS-2004) TaxID=406818 RepID=D3UWJ9_XENBS|nr:hypothetical protein [Xenorhabdus bovienii]CBJ79834.1 hypothetical protein XBJ1_0693 [Xenorhabdus bovienii SS-2004]CBJ81159.1 hypothetical protein XBJ1_2033 [Xenorhabdus bovienii SS-2004]CDH29158.1 hypothetical protein XBJ2_2270001 [Xenorhabdus bovienii str. Jollieti]
MSYEFEKIKVDEINLEDMTYAVPVLFTILAGMVTNKEPEKLDQLYKLFDKVLENNEDGTSRESIALVGQITKFSLSEK